MTKTAIFLTVTLLAGYNALRKIIEILIDCEMGTLPESSGG